MRLNIWFWGLTLSCLISFPYVFSRCQGINDISLSIYPEGTIKVLHGQPLEILCTDEKFTADDLVFTMGGQNLTSKPVNSTTRRLTIEKPRKGVYIYVCKNTVTHRNCRSYVIVDSSPTDVKDFACKSQNLDILNCIWLKPEGPSVTNYSLTLWIDENNSVDVCKAVRSDKISFCSWNTSGQPRYRFKDKQFVFYLKLCNYFGCNEQNFTIDHFTIVKPDPPRHLKVLGNGTHSVLLQWGIPNNMVDFLPLGVDHKIEYQIAKIDNTSYFRKVDTSTLPAKNKTYKFLLSDLPYAHMQYEVRIYIRPKQATKDEFWSDFTYLVFNTASGRPNRPPDTVVGAFDQNSFETARRIYVYWKQLEEYEEAGANFTYKVVVHDEVTGNPKTILADNKKSLSYVVLEDASLGAIDVDIWSTNDNGSSHNKSNLYIPPNSDTVALRVTSFTKLAYENGTYKLSWVGLNNIENYTVFWCQDNTTKICAGRINFTTLGPNKTNHVVDLPKANRYQFAISVNNGTKTSGMVWATCDTSKDGIPMYGFPVKLDHGVPGKTFVTITWTIACTLQEGIITGYVITYCPVKTPSNVCDLSFNKSTVNITNVKQMIINITDLKPYKTYHFWIALTTIYGLKKIENAFTGVTTLEDTPTSPRNVRIAEVESDSVVISWDPPLDKNGIIDKYVIYNYIAEYAFDPVPDSNKEKEKVVRRSFKLKGLDAFSNYSWSVAACNSGIRCCSPRSPSNGILLRTRIGTPSKLKPPTFNANGSSSSIIWEKPENPRGNVDLYQIKRVIDQLQEITNSTNLSYSVSECKAAEEKFHVRAVNFDTIINDHETKQTMRLEHVGEWSDPLTVNCKSVHGFSVSFILMTVLSLAVCSFITVYELIKFYKRRKVSALVN